MRTRCLVSAIQVSILSVLSAALVAADPAKKTAASWPMWGGTPNRNMVNTTDKNIATTWDVASRTNIKWVAELGTTTYGNPTVANGKVFIGTNNGNPRNDKVKADKGILMCFRQSDGQFLWQAVHDKLASGKTNDFPDMGICSGVAVEGKRLYYVSNQCQLVCADTEGFHDGKNDGVTDEKYKDNADADIIWRLDMIGELGVFPRYLASSSPLLVGDVVYVLTSNGVDEDGLTLPAPDAPSFIAVNKQDGKVIWTDKSPGDRIYEGQWSSPTYGEVNGKGQVYMPGGDGWLYAFEPLGDPAKPGKSKLIWKFDCNPPGSKFTMGGRGTANQLVSTAVFHDNRVYIPVGQDPEKGEGPGHLWAIDATGTGDVSEFVGEWDPVNRTKINAKKNPNSKLVWHYGSDANTKHSDFGRTISTVAIHGDLVFAVELAGFLHCLDVKTGKPHWKHDLLASAWSSPYVVDGKVYLGDEDGDVSIFKCSPEKTQIFPKGMDMEINMGANVSSTAVAVDGVLFLATKSHLYAIEQK